MVLNKTGKAREALQAGPAAGLPLADRRVLILVDGRRGLDQLVAMLGASAGLLIAILVITAWMAFVAAGIVWMFDRGVSWPLAIAVAALINIAGAAAVAFWARRLASEMPFTALLRQLKGHSSHEAH